MELRLHDEDNNVQSTNSTNLQRLNSTQESITDTFDPEAEFDPVSVNTSIGSGASTINYNTGSTYDSYQETSKTMYQEPPQKKLTRDEFFHKGVMLNIKSNLLGSSAALIVLTIIDIIRTYIGLKAIEALTNSFNQAMGEESISMINTSAIMTGTIIIALIIIGLAVGIYYKQSRVCACVALGLCLIFMISSFISTHRLKGYLMVLAAGYAVRETFKFNSAWEEYDTTGKYPGI